LCCDLRYSWCTYNIYQACVWYTMKKKTAWSTFNWKIFFSTYTHTHTHTHTHIHTHTYIHTYMHAYIHTYIQSYIHRCILYEAAVKKVHNTKIMGTQTDYHNTQYNSICMAAFLQLLFHIASTSSLKPEALFLKLRPGALGRLPTLTASYDCCKFYHLSL